MNKELAEAVKLFISQPLNNPLTRGQIMEVARIALPILEQQDLDSEALAISKEIMRISRDQIPGWKAMAQVQCLVVDAMKFAQGEKPLAQQESDKGEPNHAQCCAEAGGDVSICDCVNKDWFYLAPHHHHTTDTCRQIDNDGWIEWGSGECPVGNLFSDTVMVIEVRFRTGNTERSSRSEFYSWEHHERATDIIAYRIIPEQPTNQNGEQ